MTFWQMAYQFGWAQKEQLKEAVVYKLISEDDYKTITGENYTE